MSYTVVELPIDEKAERAKREATIQARRRGHFLRMVRAYGWGRGITDRAFREWYIAVVRAAHAANDFLGRR